MPSSVTNRAFSRETYNSFGFVRAYAPLTIPEHEKHHDLSPPFPLVRPAFVHSLFAQQQASHPRCRCRPLRSCLAESPSLCAVFCSPVVTVPCWRRQALGTVTVRPHGRPYRRREGVHKAHAGGVRSWHEGAPARLRNGAAFPASQLNQAHRQPPQMGIVSAVYSQTEILQKEARLQRDTIEVVHSHWNPHPPGVSG